MPCLVVPTLDSTVSQFQKHRITGLSTALPSPFNPVLSHGLTRISMCRMVMTRSLCFNTRAIDHFQCFPVYHFFQLGAPYSTVLYQIDPLNTLPALTSTLWNGVHGIVCPCPSSASEAMPYSFAETTFLSPSWNLSSSFLQCAHTTRSCWQSMFHHRVGTCSDERIAEV